MALILRFRFSITFENIDIIDIVDIIDTIDFEIQVGFLLLLKISITWPWHQ